MDIMDINKEDLIKKYKTNSIIKSGTIIIFLLLAYVLPGGFLNFLFAIAGLGLGYLAYNDHVENVDDLDSK